MCLMQIIKYVQVFQFAVCHACSKISADVTYLFNQEQILSNFGGKLPSTHVYTLCKRILLSLGDVRKLFLLKAVILFSKKVI